MESYKSLFSVLYCASQGYGEFIKPRWMNKVLAWQEPKGCYADDRQPFLKLTGFIGPATSSSPKEREVCQLVIFLFQMRMKYIWCLAHLEEVNEISSERVLVIPFKTISEISPL